MNICFTLQVEELCLKRLQILVEAPQCRILSCKSLNSGLLFLSLGNIGSIILNDVAQEINRCLGLAYTQLPVFGILELFEVWKASHASNLKHQTKSYIPVPALVCNKAVNQFVGNDTFSVRKV